MNRRSFLNKLSGFVLGCAIAVKAEFPIKEDFVSILRAHHFESVMFYHLPSFQDFLLQQENDPQPT